MGYLRIIYSNLIKEIRQYKFSKNFQNYWKIFTASPNVDSSRNAETL
jgi:hypothetical protein